MECLTESIEFLAQIEFGLDQLKSNVIGLQGGHTRDHSVLS